VKSKDSGLKWIPLWVDKWLFGSTRIELKPDERSVWIDLMVLSAKDEGYIRANESVPYSPEQLSGLLCINVELLLRTIERCKEVGKIIGKDSALYLPSWQEYSLSMRHQRRFLPDTHIKNKDKKKPQFLKCPVKFDSMKLSNGQVRYSRLIVAIAIERPLLSHEEVHHINSKDGDDDLKNLMLFRTHKDHTQFEHGFKIEPEFDGRKLTESQITAIMTEFMALIEKSREENINPR